MKHTLVVEINKRKNIISCKYNVMQDNKIIYLFIVVFNQVIAKALKN